MSYAVKEIFYTLQGEGAHVGRPAVFCRFSGCNLWSGREIDRRSAVCSFCDTDFVGTNGSGGGRFQSPEELADAITNFWPAGRDSQQRFVVFTGGEPLLQMDEALTSALHTRNFFVAVETNGTQPLPRGVDWVCVSPKAGASLQLTSGDELKLVFPQLVAQPENFSELTFAHFFLQPMDGDERDANTERAIAYCLAHPKWRLSLQTHKFLGLR
jgi:7-carboxy-7-deazaguanine synthase (Cx14CxxC type)